MQNEDNNSREFKKLSDEILKAIWQSNPVDATSIGIHDYDDTFGDVSAEGFRSSASTFQNYTRTLESKIDPSLLDTEQYLDYQLAMSQLSARFLTLESIRPWVHNPSTYPMMALWGCYHLIIRETVPLQDRMNSLLGRLREIPNMLEISKANIAEPAKLLVETAIEFLDSRTRFFREKVPAFAEQSPFLKADILWATEKAADAFVKYRNWISEKLLPNADGKISIGRDIYEQLLFSEHYITYSPETLVLLGERKLNDLEREISEIAESIDPSMDWRQLTKSLKSEHPSAHGLLNIYRKSMGSARNFIQERDIVTLPQEDRLFVEETPEFERDRIPYAAYLPPTPFDSDLTGYFWVTPVNNGMPKEQQMAKLMGHCTYKIPITALHEGYPGHHLQLTRAASVESPIRKQSVSSLFAEGWAFYCEHMMHEQGFYTDPKVRLFQLKDAIWRACRVIIDVNLHVGEMSFDEAVRMLVEVADLEEVNAIAEVKRYAMSPTQPMTYMIGDLLISDLRERMKKELNGRFSLKRFHDKLLSYGTIPPSLITQAMISGPSGN